MLVFMHFDKPVGESLIHALLWLCRFGGGETSSGLGGHARVHVLRLCIYAIIASTWIIDFIWYVSVLSHVDLYQS